MTGMILQNDNQIVSQEKSTADNIDEDALAMLEKYD